jgi:hypothetical protein
MKMCVKEIGLGLVSCGLGQGLVTGFCEYVNESLISIKYEKFLDNGQLSRTLLLGVSQPAS